MLSFGARILGEEGKSIAGKVHFLLPAQDIVLSRQQKISGS
jgi:hypothetical protein